MFKCYDCGYVFEEPKHYSEDRTPGEACMEEMEVDEDEV